MTRYVVGITIGPIIEVLSEVTKPVASWEASMFFSELCYKLCEKIARDKSLEQLSIVAPYFDAASGNSEFSKAWVGKYHDRIIFLTESEPNEVKAILDRVIKEVKGEMYNLITLKGKTESQQSEEMNYLTEYLQIHYIIKELGDNKSPISVISHYLDSLELCRTIPRDNHSNPFVDLFQCKKSLVNQHVSETGLYKNKSGAEQFQPSGEKNTVIDIEKIAGFKLKDDCASGEAGDKYNNCEKWKKYYAVVTADGDHMGQVIKNLQDTTTTEFSKKCFEYNEKAAELINKYGGIVIYAGGDDLLFLAPVCSTGQDNKNIFDLCKDINDQFNEAMSPIIEGMTLENKLSVSFGISVQYYKFPLQEALKRSRNLLEDYAKNNRRILKGINDGAKDNIARNNITFRLQKHSGQSICFGVKTNKVDIINNLLTVSNKADEQIPDKTDMGEEVLHSILYKIALNWTTLVVADNNRNELNYTEVWKNIFDNISQQKFENYINKVCMSYHNDFLANPEHWIAGYGDDDEFDRQDNNDKYYNQRKALVSILRLKHFLLQKGGE